MFYRIGNNLCLESSDSKIISLLGSWLHTFEVCLSKKLLCYGWFLFLYSLVVHEGWNQKNRAACGRCREHGENWEQTARHHWPRKASGKSSAPALCLLTQQRRTLSSLDREPGGIRIYGHHIRFNIFFQKVRCAKLSQGKEDLITVYRWLTFCLAGKGIVESRSWKVGPLLQAGFMKEVDGGGSQCFSSVLFFLGMELVLFSPG